MEGSSQSRCDCSVILHHSGEDGDFRFVKPSEAVFQTKNKKKKKKQCASQTPKKIVDFNSNELLKLDKVKAETKKCTAKCTSLPRSHAKCKEESDESENSSLNEESTIFSACSLLPPKSALRGSYEELGLGPRPKLHVKWSPSVWEPPCSTVSHTVNSNSKKKKDSSHKVKGRTGCSYSHKLQEKRKPHKVDCNSRSRHWEKHKTEYGLAETPHKVLSMDSGQELKESGPDILLNLDLDKPKEHESCEVTKDHLQLSLRNSVMDGFQYTTDLPCGISLVNVPWDTSTMSIGQAM